MIRFVQGTYLEPGNYRFMSPVPSYVEFRQGEDVVPFVLVAGVPRVLRVFEGVELATPVDNPLYFEFHSPLARDPDPEPVAGHVRFSARPPRTLQEEIARFMAASAAAGSADSETFDDAVDFSWDEEAVDEFGTSLHERVVLMEEEGFFDAKPSPEDVAKRLRDEALAAARSAREIQRQLDREEAEARKKRREELDSEDGA